MSFINRPIVCALLASATPCLRATTVDATTPAPMQEALTLRIDGQLTIDPQGVPTEYQIQTELPQKLRDSLQQHVRDWRFEPVLVGGKPVLAQTQMRVTLAARTIGAIFRVTVDNVTFPQTQGQTPDASADFQGPTEIGITRSLPIVYPQDAIRYGLEADVMVNLKLSKEGRVEQAFVEQTALHHVQGKPRDLQDAVQLFERAALTDIKFWRFSVVVHVADLKPQDLTVRVPMHFSTTDTAGTPIKVAGWQQEVRTPERRAPWLPIDATPQSANAADLASGELAPFSGRFRLTTSVVGIAL